MNNHCLISFNKFYDIKSGKFFVMCIHIFVENHNKNIYILCVTKNNIDYNYAYISCIYYIINVLYIYTSI